MKASTVWRCYWKHHRIFKSCHAFIVQAQTIAKTLNSRVFFTKRSERPQSISQVYGKFYV